VTRVVVGQEEVLYPDGRLIRKGALHCDEEIIPVVHQESMDHIIGAARGLQRAESDSTDKVDLTMDITLFDFVVNQMRIDLLLCDPTVFIAPFTGVELDNRFVITDGRIREIVLSRKLPNGVEKN
jgi:hypothetical protein